MTKYFCMFVFAAESYWYCTAVFKKNNNRMPKTLKKLYFSIRSAWSSSFKQKNNVTSYKTTFKLQNLVTHSL